jgi:hypothetical protein
VSGSFRFVFRKILVVGSAADPLWPAAAEFPRITVNRQKEATMPLARLSAIADEVEELTIDDAPEGCERRFQFRLCRREVPMGDVSVDQWWMPWRSVYPDRQRMGDNYDAIVKFFEAAAEPA